MHDVWVNTSLKQQRSAQLAIHDSKREVETLPRDRLQVQIVLCSITTVMTVDLSVACRVACM
jgi:hypothetical protein